MRQFTLIQGNACQLPIPDNTIDMVITSPPYNVGIEYDNSDDNLTIEQYLQFTHAWLSACFRALKDDGRIAINVPFDTQGYEPISSLITCQARDIGYKYKTTIVWNKNTVSNRTAWGSWLSASAPHIIAPVELIIVLYKNTYKKQSGSQISTMTRSEFLQYTDGLWTFAPEDRTKTGHPAPFPLELPLRLIKMFTYQGDTILDPFAGTATTLLAAISQKRRAIGIELSPQYIQLAKKRLEKSIAQGFQMNMLQIVDK